MSFFLSVCASLEALPLHALALICSLSFNRLNKFVASAMFFCSIVLYQQVSGLPFLFLFINYLTFTTVALLLLFRSREPQLYRTLLMTAFLVMISEVNLYLYYRFIAVPDLSFYLLNLLFKIFVNLLAVLLLSYLLTQLDRILISRIRPYLFPKKSMNLKKMRHLGASRKPFGLS